jgi:hypothetical protein
MSKAYLVSEELLRQVLDALDEASLATLPDGTYCGKNADTADALHTLLAKEPSEPVAWAYFTPEGALMYSGNSKHFIGYLGNVYPCQPLYRKDTP